jgi:hypothetical protein
VLLTVWCITIVLGSVCAAGVPAAWLLNGRRPLTEADYVKAPFLGLAVIVLVLQNLVYLDVPIRLSGPFFWVGVGLCWIWIWRRGGTGGFLRTVPWPLILACLLVYLLQGLGLVALGAREYVGRAWSDEFNYTAIAQFLCEEPFSTSWASCEHRPYLNIVVHCNYRWDRIGQSVAHGFFSVSSGCDAKTLFGPTILLGPAFVTAAVYGLAWRSGLARRVALTTGVAAGLLPSLALLQLECFLSHVLGIPLFLLALLLVDELNERQDPSTFGRACLVVAAMIAIYTEFWVLFLGVSALGLVLAIRRPPRWRLLLCYALLTASPFALNPWFAPRIFYILTRVDQRVLAHVYPWAFSVEGLSRVWFGDLAVPGTAWIESVVRVCSLGATVLAVWGLIRNWRERRLTPATVGDEAARQPGWTLAWCFLAVAALPLVVFVKDERHPYQLYKMLITVSPLLPLGLALFMGRRLKAAVGHHSNGVAGIRHLWNGIRQPVAIMVGVAVLAGWASSRMAYETRLSRPLSRFAQSHYLLDPDVRELQSRLSALPEGELVFAFHDPTDGFLNSWLSYFARRQQIWMTDGHFIDLPVDMAGVEDIVGTHAQDSPSDLLILTHKGGFQSVDCGELTPVWVGRSFWLWKLSTGAWAVPTAFDNPAGLNDPQDQGTFWVGAKSTTIEVLASQPGEVILNGAFLPGPSLPETDVRHLRIRSSRGYESELVSHGSVEELRVPICSGKTTITIEALDTPSLTVLPNGDPRTLLVLVQKLSFRFCPEDRPQRPQAESQAPSAAR